MHKEGKKGDEILNDEDMQNPEIAIKKLNRKHSPSLKKPDRDTRKR